MLKLKWKFPSLYELTYPKLRCTRQVCELRNVTQAIFPLGKRQCPEMSCGSCLGYLSRAACSLCRAFLSCLASALYFSFHVRKAVLTVLSFAFFDVLCPSLHPGASKFTIIHGYHLASKTQDTCSVCAGQVTWLMRTLEMGS